MLIPLHPWCSHQLGCYGNDNNKKGFYLQNPSTVQGSLHQLTQGI